MFLFSFLQLTNRAYSLDIGLRNELHNQVDELRTCRGKKCTPSAKSRTALRRLNGKVLWDEYVYMFIRLYVYMFMYLYVHIFICLCVYMFIHYVYMFVCLHIYVYMFICLCVYADMFIYFCMFIYLLICLYVYLFMCVYVFQFMLFTTNNVWKFPSNATSPKIVLVKTIIIVQNPIHLNVWYDEAYLCL